jgi:Family of unknown function (DUF5946)
MIACPACGLTLPDVPGPGHDYITASPACWARFNDSMALHYQDRAFWPAHGLLVDAYMVQHSTGDDPRARRSAVIHLAALHALLALRWPEPRVIALRGRLAKSSLPEPPPRRRPSRTIADVATDAGPERHLASVMTYAHAVLTDYAADLAAVLPLFEAA